ncbi:MAG TPA: hypothetical protein VII30_07725 [Gemmatimonadaceae bacterium]|jgi:hypothetical protein
MNPKFNFAPVSSAQSGLLRFASAWLVFNGVVYGLLVVAAVGRFVFSHQLPAPTILVVFSLLINAMAAAGIVWSGLLLARGRRFGGYLALGFVLLPIVFAAFSRTPLDIFQVAFAVLGVLVLALCWQELK